MSHALHTDDEHGAVVARVREAAIPFQSVERFNPGPLLDRIGDARVVLLGDGTHGTREMYALRARITGALLSRKGFRIVAVEGDWPDAAHVDAFVGHRERAPDAHEAFARFPRWMWRNAETAEFIEGLRHHNATLSRGRRAGFYGLDLYSLFASLDGVLRWLDESAPDVAARARERYACLAAWEESPQSYGRAATLGATEQCEEKAVAMLRELLARRLEIAGGDDAGFFDALMNARLIANAERYYRAMFGGAVDSWNVRDTHMMETLEALLERNGPDARAVVWAHNSHVGDARATWQGAHGEINIGQLARERFPGETFSLGMFTHAGTVAAASRWDGALEMKRVQPSRPDSYEHAFHDVGHAAFCLPMRDADARVRAALAVERLQRAIGVIYRPETERQSHYFEGCLPAQFDEVVFLDETQAVTPLDSPDRLVGAHERAPELPATFPSGL